MLAINSLVDGGRFQIIDVLGKGGSGIAYLAYDTHSSPKHPKYYAIKCVPRPASEADSSALLREIRLHKLVAQHPGIVTLKRCIQEGPYQLFIMDFLPGGDLFRQITQQRTFSLSALCSSRSIPSTLFVLHLSSLALSLVENCLFGRGFISSFHSINSTLYMKCATTRQATPPPPLTAALFSCHYGD